jgi:prepilin-type N-terminal cleavage/methylation domain-containing protein
VKRAFTLIEVVVALTIAGIIALAARAAIVAGLDTHARLQQHVAQAEGDARFRALVIQLLRHLSEAPTAATPPFVVRDTVTAAGPSQVLEFYSRGLGFPAGSGPVAAVRIGPSDGGLTISAGGADRGSTLHGTLASATALRVRLLTLSGDWLPSWPRTLQLPAAVTVEFVSAAAGSAALVVSTRPAADL